MFSTLFALLGCARAQTADAVLSGTVTDPSGGVVSATAIRATHLSTGVVSRVMSNHVGVYLFASMAPGTYELTAEKEGFRKLVLSEVQLEVGARLSISLELVLGAVKESVEVNGQQQSAMASATASVGTVIGGRQIVDLPLTSRNALEFLVMSAGAVGANVNGARIGMVNVQIDGVNTQDPRINQLASGNPASFIAASVDRIAEVRVVTSPADAELGRGSAQVQMITRSGTNHFHGGLWDFHQNSALNANNWFNNQRGAAQSHQVLNAFGGRVGGPVIRNKTFFHVLYDASYSRSGGSVTRTVYTETARRGLFRFFPGAMNANAGSASRVVDLAGNPVKPFAASGDLQTVSVYGRDPNRPGPDPTGSIAALLAQTPLPNDFRSVGDGLNVAGYTWAAPVSNDQDQVVGKLDHQLGDKHRLSFGYTWQSLRQVIPPSTQPVFPNSPSGSLERKVSLYTMSVTSVLAANRLNEFRAGVPFDRIQTTPPAPPGGLPLAGTQPYIPVMGVTSPIVAIDPQGRKSANYQVFDKVSYLRGHHAFKAGGEWRSVDSNSFSLTSVTPRITFGAGGAAVQNISTIPGIGGNAGTAMSLLNNLSGSVANVSQTLNATGGQNPVFLPGESYQRTWRQHEFSGFVQDDYRIHANLTLYLGLRYEFYGVPYEANGRAAGLVGGSGAIFGISGTTFGDMFQPGRSNGSLTRIELVGKNSPHPGWKLYEDDWNNFAPAAGLAWNLPWFGKNQTVFRAGYGIGYERNALVLTDTIAGLQPGLSDTVTLTSPAYLDLTRLLLPLRSTRQPLETVPLTSRSQTVRVFDSGLRTPYVQNWSASLQRALPLQMTIEARYAGSKGTRLIRGSDLNETNIFENGLLEAFRITQAGGNAPLFDRLLMGLNVGGGIVNGTTLTGSQALRANSTYQGILAANAVGSLAIRLNNLAEFTPVPGGVLRNGAFPENWIVVNPQFSGAVLTGNFANSTYHSMQIEIDRRFGTSVILRAGYTWSKALGEEEGSSTDLRDEYRTQRDRSFDKRLLGFDRTHALRGHFLWKLPLGARRRWLGGWQIGSVFQLTSGAPIQVTSQATSFNAFCCSGNTPSAGAIVDKGLGSVHETGDGVVYFAGLQQIPDPSIAKMTPEIGSRSTLRAITDSSGRVLFLNPLPGTFGSLAPNFLRGPGLVRWDANFIKRVSLGEAKEIALNGTIQNLLNRPQFDGPSNLDINSPNFGQITSASGSRIVVMGLRLSF